MISIAAAVGLVLVDGIVFVIMWRKWATPPIRDRRK